MANRNWLSNKMYQMEAYPVLVSCTFTVDNTAGAGVSNLKGGAVKAVYMNSTSPSDANPNPGVGVIQVELQDNYNKILGLSSVLEGPVTGSNLTSATAGTVYQITAVGTTTLAQWQTAGVPVGMVPAVGVVFVCKTTGALGGTGTVKALATVAVNQLDLMSDDQNLQRENSMVNGGSVLILCTRSGGALTAPAANSIIRLNMYLSNSSVTVQGQ